MNKKSTTIKMTDYEDSPKTILPETKLITNWNGKFWRGVETKDFIYFCNYQEGDDNGSVKMYRKDGLELVSDNHFAHGDLMSVISEKRYTYLSKSMKFNAREIQREEAENELTN